MCSFAAKFIREIRVIRGLHSPIPHTANALERPRRQRDEIRLPHRPEPRLAFTLERMCNRVAPRVTRTMRAPARLSLQPFRPSRPLFLWQKSVSICVHLWLPPIRPLRPLPHRLMAGRCQQLAFASAQNEHFGSYSALGLPVFAGRNRLAYICDLNVS